MSQFFIANFTNQARHFVRNIPSPNLTTANLPIKNTHLTKIIGALAVFLFTSLALGYIIYYCFKKFKAKVHKEKNQNLDPLLKHVKNTIKEEQTLQTNSIEQNKKEEKQKSTSIPVNNGHKQEQIKDQNKQTNSIEQLNLQKQPLDISEDIIKEDQVTNDNSIKQVNTREQLSKATEDTEDKIQEEDKRASSIENINKPNPTPAMIAIDLGTVLLNQNEIDKAHEQFKVIFDSENIEDLNQCATILKAKNLNEEAKEFYHKVLKLDPNNIEALNGLGSIYKKASDPSANSCFEQILRIEPENIKAHINFAKTLPDLDQALKYLADVTTRYPKNSTLLFLYGRCLSMQGTDLTKMEEHFTKALELDPKNSKKWLNYGKILSKLHQFEKAILAFKEALNIDPKNSKIWCTYGKILSSEKRFDEAILAYDEVLKIDPNQEGILRRSIEILITQGKFEEAEKRYHKILQNYSGQWTIKIDYGLFLLNIKKFKEAESELQQYLTHQPTSTDALTYYALSLEKQGKMSEVDEVNHKIAVIRNKYTDDNSYLSYQKLFNPEAFSNQSDE